MENTKTVLKPIHTSFDSAYVIESYPYGRLRTQMRVWIETKKNHGQRVMRCTLNPKNGEWNKPHASIYNNLFVLYINSENGHLESAGLNNVFYSAKDCIDYLNEYQEGLTEYQIEFLNKMIVKHNQNVTV